MPSITTNGLAAIEPGGSLKPISYELGDLNANEIIIDVEYCGICHSDLSMVDNDWGISQYPLVPGHEVIGKIASVGPGVHHLNIGDSVGLGWHCGYCNECACCKSGDQNLCATARPTIVGHHGGFADKVKADANSVVVIPEGVDLATAGPLMCAGITVFNPMIQFGVSSTDRVAVIGIGGLGHLAVKFLSAWGCEVTAFTSSEDKKNEAASFGADHTLDSRDAEAIEQAANSFDYLISTVNVKLDWNQYVSTLKPKGTMVFVGATLDPLDLGVMPLILGQRTIAGSTVGSPAVMEQMLQFASRHQISPLVEQFAMSSANSAMSHVREGKPKYRVVLANN
ncbi:MAG: NAD(P)-dependent alcohol dehydrogenase [Mariniblastus sp.]|nr:NAD(P)-dependent alcohol dehydrogenase [Mariniblastus sp.]